jgi:hypothetical protein
MAIDHKREDPRVLPLRLWNNWHGVPAYVRAVRPRPAFVCEEIRL